MSSRFSTENATNTREKMVFRSEDTSYPLHTKTPATMIDAPCRQLIGPSVAHVSILFLIRETHAPPRSRASLGVKVSPDRWVCNMPCNVTVEASIGLSAMLGVPHFPLFWHSLRLVYVRL
jgi:hypothetical protein